MHPILGDGLSHYSMKMHLMHSLYTYTPIYMPCTTSIIDPKWSAAMRCGFLTCLHFVQQTWLHAIYKGCLTCRKTSPHRGLSAEHAVHCHAAVCADVACRAFQLAGSFSLQEMCMLLFPARPQAPFASYLLRSLSRSSWRT